MNLKRVREIKFVEELTQKRQQRRPLHAALDSVPYHEMLPVEWLLCFVVAFHFVRLKDQRIGNVYFQLIDKPMEIVFICLTTRDATPLLKGLKLSNDVGRLHQNN